VVVCWIEGGWGSYTSYAHGPPMHNKRRDWWHHVRIAIEKPQVLPAEVLASSWTTRRYLMEACLACRRYLGLTDAATKVEWTAEKAAEEKQESSADE
jgi:hypothetical protein